MYARKGDASWPACLACLDGPMAGIIISNFILAETPGSRREQEAGEGRWKKCGGAGGDVAYKYGVGGGAAGVTHIGTARAQNRRCSFCRSFHQHKAFSKCAQPR